MSVRSTRTVGLRTMTIGALSTALVVGLGVLVTLAGGVLPGALWPSGAPVVTVASSVASDPSLDALERPRAEPLTARPAAHRADGQRARAPRGQRPTRPTREARRAEPQPAEAPGTARAAAAAPGASAPSRTGPATTGPATTAPASPAAEPVAAAEEDPVSTAEARVAQEAAAATTPFTMAISSFNILGSQHTAPGGAARGYAPGRLRAEWAARIVVGRGIDVVGWSELQRDQYAVLMQATNGLYEAWPGTTLGSKGLPASLMWRTDRYSAVWKGTVTIPFMGQERPMPMVQLQHLATGRQFFVMNVHNAPRDREAERNVAEARELSMIRSTREESGLPVLLTGDFNERAEIFCTVLRETDLHAAAGGNMDGGCHPPRPMKVDWIFGSPEAAFSRYVAERSPLVRRITDHAALFTSVTIT